MKGPTLKSRDEIATMDRANRIVVGVALDTVAAIETHMITRSYEGFMKGGRIRGRR